MNNFAAISTFAIILVSPLTGAEPSPTLIEVTGGTPAILEGPNQDYFVVLGEARRKYRKTLAQTLSEADKIEVFLLDFAPEPVKGTYFMWDNNVPDGFFPITPYQAQSRVLARKTLSSAETKLLLVPLQANIVAEKPGGGAMCHYPIHGIRAWSKKTILFQTSFCWTCKNFYLKYPDDNASWIGVSDPAIRNVLTQLMPIPQSEIDRFNKSMDSQR